MYIQYLCSFCVLLNVNYYFCFAVYFNSSNMFVFICLADTGLESDTQERSGHTVTTEVQLFTKAYVHFCPICVRFYCLSDHNICISIGTK